jgi:hypothetical protein
MSGRVTAANADYPYSSSKNETTPGAGDGTPYFKARADDLFGMQQAILRAAGIVPTGNADTALASQYLQGIIQQAQGRASLYDDTGAADAYVLALQTNQLAPGGVFDGQRLLFSPDNTNTGASTVDISALLAQAAGTTIIDVKLYGGTTNPRPGVIVSGVEVELVYRISPSVHAQVKEPIAILYPHGRVDAAGTVAGASGFSGSWASGGLFTLTHNWGTVNYTALATSEFTNYDALVSSRDANSVTFIMRQTSTGAGASYPFNWSLALD